MTALVLDDVHVEYGGVSALAGLCARVGPGEWTCLIGPNGAGKSTLLRAIAGLVPSTGSITVGARRLSGLAPREIARLVAYVPQTPVLPDDITVADYVLLGRTPHLSYWGRERKSDLDAVVTVLERLDLLPFAPRHLDTLSGGERQRVVMARALAQQAPVLLLDEPTSALDVGHQQQVLELVEDLRHDHGLTVVSAMHDLTLAGQFAERFVLLAGGRVVASGPASTVLTESVIGEHYGASVRVLRDEHGGTVVIPVRQPTGGARRRADTPARRPGVDSSGLDSASTHAAGR